MLQKSSPRSATNNPSSHTQTAKVLVIHASETGAKLGGIANATIFYALALTAAGYPAEIWTPSQTLADRAQALGVPVFRHRWLCNAGIALLHPTLIWKALTARRHAAAVMHQGEKLWLFGRVWLTAIPESVVFHNVKIHQRQLFRRWLAISVRHKRELEVFARAKRLHRTIALIRNGPLPIASELPRCKPADRIQTIGCLGNFRRKKAVPVLVRAFAELIKRGHDVRLVLGGEGPERPLCQELAKQLGVSGRIDWPGWNNDTRSFFKQIDLFCLPSRNEPFGLVITEAMQAGLAVVATDTSGPRDIVIPGKTGWIVPVDDAEALADALEEAISNPALTRSYGIAGFHRYQENYAPLAAGKILAEALGLR